MGIHIVVSVSARDLVASGPGTVGADPSYSDLQTTAGATGHVEWKVDLPSAGRWRLHAHMTAAIPRPCALTINGVKQAGDILGEITGGWHKDRLRWVVHGPYTFDQGENRLRIDFTGGQPHLLEFGFSKVEPVDLKLPWVLLQDTQSLLGIAVLRDGALLGVLTDRTLAIRPRAAEGWQPLPGIGDVIAATQLRDGTLVAVGADHTLRARATPGAPWIDVPSSGAVVAVTGLGDGALLGVGVDKQLYTRATLASPWVRVPSSGDVIGVVELASGTLLGVGADRQLNTRATLTDTWAPIPDSGDVLAVAELPNGTLLAVNGDGKLCAAGRIAPPAEARGEAGAGEAGARLHATGLEDYGYWLRWKESLPPHGAGDGKPFRRGVVWR
jgi:cyanobactin cluster PatC/TenC/TruC protein